MTGSIALDTNLTDADNSVLIGIDVQQAFLDKLDSLRIASLIQR